MKNETTTKLIQYIHITTCVFLQAINRQQKKQQKEMVPITPDELVILGQK